jgi:hypothetical protein
MAENSVTIKLNLDTSGFSSQMAQVKREMSSMGMGGSRGSGGGAGGGGVRANFAEQLSLRRALDATKQIEKSFQAAAQFSKKNLAMDVRAADARMKEAVKMNIAARGAMQAPKPGGMFGQAFAGKDWQKIKGETAKFGSAMMGNISAGNVAGIIETIGTASLSTLGVIAAGVMLLVVAMSALSMVFKPIQKLLEAIGKVLGAALMPIAMVIVQLLKPLIWIMMPFVRIMNAIFAPLRTALRNFLTGRGKELIQEGRTGQFSIELALALGQGMAGMLVAAFGEVMKIQADLVGMMMKTIVDVSLSYLQYAVTMIDTILYAIPGVPKEVHEGLQNLAKGIGETREAITGKGGTIDQVILQFKTQIDTGVNTLLTALGLGKDFAKQVQDTNDAINKAKESLPKSGETGTPAGGGGDFGLNFYSPVLGPDGLPINHPNSITRHMSGGTGQTPGSADYVSALPGATDNGPPQKSYVDMFFEFITTGWDLVSGKTQKAMATEQPSSIPGMFGTGMAGSSAQVQLGLFGATGIMPAFTMFTVAAVALADYMVQKANDYAASIKSSAGSGGSGSDDVSDFVLQPGGNLIRTSPADYIFGTRNPSSMGGSGGVTNITINVEGNVDEKTSRYITQTIQREIAQQWRAIAR